MPEKTKTYQLTKFPYDLIVKACDEFVKSVNVKFRKSLIKGWEVSYSDSEWKFDDEKQFAHEYAKDETNVASLYYTNGLELVLRIRYENYSYGKSKTRITIALPDRNKVDLIFNIFETYYSQFLAQIKEESLGGSHVTPLYSFEGKLPSLYIDKKLLTDLEHYILQRAKQIQITKQSKDYSVVILDSSGTLALQSIAYYPRDIFDNETEHITLSYGNYSDELRIYLKFAKQKSNSKIEISFKGENARDIVESIKVGIFQLFKDAGTWNAIYHPHLLIQSIFVWLFLFVAGNVILFIIRDNIWSQPFIVATLILLLYLIAPNLKPYTTFDTRRNALLRKWSGWLVESLLGILLIWLVSLLFPIFIP